MNAVTVRAFQCTVEYVSEFGQKGMYVLILDEISRYSDTSGQPPPLGPYLSQEMLILACTERERRSDVDESITPEAVDVPEYASSTEEAALV